MMLPELLTQLDALGVKIGAVDGKLRVDAPQNALTEAIRAALAEHKTALLDHLIGASAPMRQCAPIAPMIEEGCVTRVMLDDLIFGDYLERNGLRVVGGTPSPDGRVFRPTIYTIAVHDR
jgi:hypothetical protein